MKSRSPGPIVFFDGYCVFCRRWARILRKIDRKKQLRLIPTHSDEFKIFITTNPVPISPEKSVIFLYHSRYFEKSEAVLQICHYLGFPWSIFGLFRIIPGKILDKVYDWIARNRYRWFGRNENCRVPDK